MIKNRANVFSASVFASCFASEKNMNVLQNTINSNNMNIIGVMANFLMFVASSCF